MKLRKISEDVLECIFSAEEVSEYHLQPSDLSGQSAKGREIVGKIFRNAALHLDFDSSFSRFQMEFYRRPGGRMAVVMRREPAREAPPQKFADVSLRMRAVASGIPGGDTAPDELDEIKDWPNTALEFRQGSRIPPLFWRAGTFSALLKAGRLLSEIPFLEDVFLCISHLYALPEGEFVLVLRRGVSLSAQEHCCLINALSEYLDRIPGAKGYDLYLAEHAVCIFRCNAFAGLAALAES